MTPLLDFFGANPAIAWATIGVAFLIAEILMSSGFFLSFAAAGFVIAALELLGLAPQSLLWTVLIFCVLGAALAPLFRKLLRRYLDRMPDISQH